MNLTPVQRDRAAAVLLATAAGDALGAPYEFKPAGTFGPAVPMKAGGGWERGEWTDDTAMAVPIAEAAAAGDLRSVAAQDLIVRRWIEWYEGSPKDCGIQTGEVLEALDGALSAKAREVSKHLHERHGRTAGNGSLMRTAPVALAYLDDPDGLTEAAKGVAVLTHYDPLNGEACTLWCHAIARAVLAGELDLRAGLGQLADDRQRYWTEKIEEAERLSPRDFPNDGFVVAAFQGAWAAIHGTEPPADDPRGHLRLALEEAVRGGNDTDTVAAIAGGLLGATYGVSAVPSDWQEHLHGWPGLDGADLVALAESIVDRAT